MKFVSSQVKELQAEEQHCLDRVEARTKKLMAEAHLPRLAAYSRAVMSLPETYATYCSVRRQLAQFRVPPIIAPGMGLSRGDAQQQRGSEDDADDE